MRSAPGQRLTRVNSRNGYRDLDTRVGTLDVAVPNLRIWSLRPDWLLELVQTLGVTGLSKSRVSVMATDLDVHVERFRTPLPSS